MVEAIVGVALRAILASVVLGGVLAALVLLATRTLALTAATRHALWTTALVATAVMPIAGILVSVARAAAPQATSISSPASSYHETAPRRDASRAHDAGVATTPAVSTAVPSRAVPPSPWTSVVSGFAQWAPRVSRELALAVVALWIAGAAAGLIGLAGSIVRVRGLKRRSSPLDGTLADDLPWLTDAKGEREIYLRLSYETETPVAVGFRRPVILIPHELATARGLGAIEQLVMHEHAHLSRYDDWTNLVQRTIERLFWFNPIVWLVGRKIALEREIASDDAVVAKTGAAHAYATSLWRLAREMRMPEHAVVAPGALLTRKQITIRIEQLLSTKRAQLHRSPAAALGIALAGVLAVAFVATSAPAVELPAAAPAAASLPVAVATAPAKPAAPLHAAVPHPAARPVAAPKVATHVEQWKTQLVVANARPLVAPSPRVVIQRVVIHDKPVAASAAPPAPAVPAVPAISRADGAAIGTGVAQIVHDALASVPREIAQESTVQSDRARRADGAKLSRELIASCVGCSFHNADLRGLDLHGLKISADDFTGADMRGVNLSGAALTGVSLSRANLANADLRNAVLTGVALRSANFDGALLDGIKFVGVSISASTFHGAMLRSVVANCTGCDFAKLDLRGVDLHGLTLTGADMRGADLRDANLSGARLIGVDLAGANLAGANLTNVQLEGCDLTGIDLRGARTSGMVTHGSGFDG